MSIRLFRALPCWLAAVTLLCAATFARAEDAPPAADLNVLVKEMTAEGAVAGGLGTFTMKLTVRSLRPGWQSLRLLPGDVSLTDFRVRVGDDDFVHLRRSAAGVDLLLGKEGTYGIDLGFVARVKEDKAGKSLTLPFAPAVRSMVTFTVPEVGLKVTTDPVSNFGTSEKDGKTEIVVYGGAASQVNVTWQSRGVDLKVGNVVFAEQRALLVFARGVLRVDSTFDFHIVQGAISELKFEIGEGLNLMNVVGEQVRSWNVADENNTRVLKISLLKEMEKSYSLMLQFERNLEGIPITVAAPRVAVLGVEREKGAIAIAARKGIKVEVASAKDIAQVDVQELPQDLKTSDDMQLGFKYLKRPFEATLAVSEVTPKVTADVFTMARLSKDTLRLSTAINYKIRDAGVFRFAIRLPEGLKLLDLGGRDINTQQVKDNVLTVDLRSKAEGEYRLMLETERPVKDAADVVVPAIEVLDVEREWGYVALSTVPGVKAETRTFEGIRQINVRELAWSLFDSTKAAPPAEGKGGKETAPAPDREPVELAFRYLRHPYKLSVGVTDVMPEVTVETRGVYAVTDKNLELNIDLAYDIRKAGVFSLKAWLAPELRIVAVDGPNLDDWKRDEKDGVLTVTLKSKVEGAYTLTIRTEAPVADVTKGLSMPAFAVRDVKKERGHLAISTAPDLRVKTDAKGTTKLTEIDLKDLPATLAPRAASFAIAYKYFESPWTLGLSVEKVKPRVTAETFSFVSIAEQLVTCSTTLRFSILYAGVSQFKVQLPPGVNDPDIEGDAIKHKEKTKSAKEGDGDIWTVTLHSPQTGAYTLYMTFQREVKDKGGAVAFTGPRVIPIAETFDLERETGFLAFAARPDVEMSAPSIADLTPIDDKEIPTEYKRGITVPILMAFRYLRHPYSFSASIRQNEFAKVLVAVVEALRLSTTITLEGHTITDVAARVRNTREQYLRLELPGDAEIWSLFVAGIQETPFQTQENGKMVTLVPIAKAARGDETFDVRLRFGRKQKALAVVDTIDLTAPPLNLPVLRLGWTVSLPPNYELVADAGNMRRVYGFTESELVAANPDAPIALNPQGGAPQPGGGDQQSLRNAEVIRQMKDGRSGAGLSSMVSGARPQDGKSFHFQTLISLDEPGRIKSRCVRTSVGLTSQGVLVLLVLLACLLAWRVPGVPRSTRVGWLGAAALLLLGVHTLMEQTYQDYMSVIVLTTAACFAAGLVTAVGGAILAWWRARQDDGIRIVETVVPAPATPVAPPAGPTSPAAGPTSPSAPSGETGTPPAGGAGKGPSAS